MISEVNILAHIRYALSNYFVNTGNHAKYIYLGQIQYDLLRAERESAYVKDGELEFMGAEILCVDKDSHVRVS